MLPTYEDYQQGVTTWYDNHRGVRYHLKHHSISEAQPEGIWCAYINLYEHQAKDFDKFYCEDKITQWYPKAPYRIINDCFKVPDMGFSGGITYYKNDTYINPETGEPNRMLTIGCDYNHLWDRERGYPDNFYSIKQDIKKVIDNYLDNGYRLCQNERKEQ